MEGSGFMARIKIYQDVLYGTVYITALLCLSSKAVPIGSQCAKEA
jgi:hypothetical protein